MSTQMSTRKATTGEPGNKGEFGTRERTASDVTLPVIDTAPEVPDYVETGFREIDTFDFDGETLHVTTDDAGEYQVWSQSTSEYIDDYDIATGKRDIPDGIGGRKPPTPVQVRTAAITHYAQVRSRVIREFARRLPEAKEQLVAEADRIDELAKNASKIARKKQAAREKHPTLI